MEEPHNSFLERLQTSPHHVKRRYLVWGTAAVMLVIVGIWLLNLRTFLRLDPPVRSTATSTAP